MTARLFFRQLVRESRGARGRLVFFTLCLAVGVAGVVAVAGFSSALREALRTEARRLLGGDLRVEGLRALPEPGAELLAGVPGARVVRLWEMPTMAAAPAGARGAGTSRLVELRAVEGDYPFYGELGLEPARPLAELLAGDGAVAAPELATALGLELGDPLSVGGRLFVLRGLVRSEPDRIGGAFALGPRLFLSGESLLATGLVALGSRVEHRTLVALPEGSGSSAATELAARLRAALPEPQFHRVETAAQGQPELRRGVDRTERFLGLIALLSLLVGGVGVAQTARAWLATRLDAIAVWKTLGARPREIALLHLAQVVLLAFGGSVAGALAGVALQRIVPPLVAGLLPDLPLPAFQPLAALRGLALGVAVALLFALAPLVAALRVPAARVLRRDAEPIPAPRALRLGLAAALFAGTAGFAALQTRSLLEGALFAAGLAATAALLAGAARAARRRCAAPAAPPAADAAALGQSRRSGAPARARSNRWWRSAWARSSSSPWPPSSATW